MTSPRNLPEESRQTLHTAILKHKEPKVATTLGVTRLALLRLTLGLQSQQRIVQLASARIHALEDLKLPTPEKPDPRNRREAGA